MKKCVFLFCLLGPALLAQTTGSLSGKVVSQSGDPLPGATVVIESPQLMGTRTDTTRQDGSFLFFKAPPGQYTLTVTMGGMKTAKQETRVRLSIVSRPTIVLYPELTTSLVVSAKEIPELDNTGVVAHFSADFIEKMAMGRRISQAVLLAPGTSFRGTNAVTVSGANAGLNTYLVNGVDSRFDNLTSQPSDTVVEDSVQETTILTSLISARYGQFLGGVINTVTKSGGNTFSGTFRQALTNNSWRARDPLVKSAGVERQDKIDRTNTVTLGGPIMKDRLWFFLAGQKRDRTSETLYRRPPALSDPAADLFGLPRGQTMPAGSVPNSDLSVERIEGKLTARLSPGQKLSFNYMTREDLQRNWAVIPMDKTPLTDRTTTRRRYNATLESTFSPNFQMEFKYAKRESIFRSKSLPDYMQQRLDAGESIQEVGTLFTDGTFASSANFSLFGGTSEEPRNNETFYMEADAFLVTNNWGSHDLVFGLSHSEDSRFANDILSPNNWGISSLFYYFEDDRVVPIMAGAGLPASVQANLVYAPRLESSQTNRYKVASGYINDSWSLNDSWRFNLGLRYDQNEGRAQDGLKTADDHILSPRLSAGYDLFGDGKHELRLGYAVYGQRITDVANSGSRAGDYRQAIIRYGGPSTDSMVDVINWVNETYGDNFFADPFNHAGFDQFLADTWYNDITEQRLTVFGQVNPDGGYTPRELKTPRADELSLSYAYRIGSRGFLRADFVHRKFRDFYVAHTNLQTGKTPDGAHDLTVINNDDDLYNKEYNSVQVQFSSKLSDQLSFRGNYTWSQLIGNWDGGLSTGASVPASDLTAYPEINNFPGRAPRRYLPGDIRHAANLFLLYNMKTRLGIFDFGLSEHIISGSPIDYWQRIFVGTNANAEAYGLPNAAALGYVNGPQDTFYHLDQKRGQTTYETHLGINWSKPTGRGAFFIQLDIFNIFNASRYGDGSKLDNQVVSTNLAPFNVFEEVPVEGVNYILSPTTGTPFFLANTGYQAARSLTIDFGFRF